MFGPTGQGKKNKKDDFVIEGEYVTWDVPLTKNKFRAARAFYVKHDYPFARNDAKSSRAWKWSHQHVDAMFEFLVNSQSYEEVAYKQFHDKKTGLRMPAVIRNRKRAQFARQFRQYCREKEIEPPSLSMTYKILAKLPARSTKMMKGNI